MLSHTHSLPHTHTLTHALPHTRSLTHTHIPPMQVSPLTLDARMWPRASPVAERLWSPRTVTDQEFAATRLREHRCRMVFLLGIRAGPFWSERCVPH